MWPVVACCLCQLVVVGVVVDDDETLEMKISSILNEIRFRKHIGANGDLVDFSDDKFTRES